MQISLKMNDLDDLEKALTAGRITSVVQDDEQALSLEFYSTGLYAKVNRVNKQVTAIDSDQYPIGLRKNSSDAWKVYRFPAGRIETALRNRICEILTKAFVKKYGEALGITEDAVTISPRSLGITYEWRYENAVKGLLDEDLAIEAYEFYKRCLGYQEVRTWFGKWRDCGVVDGTLFMPLGVYNYYWANKEGLKEVETKAPGLIAFIPAMIRWKCQATRRDDGSVDLTWSHSQNVFAELKHYLETKYGITKSTWKTLLGLKALQGRWLANDSGEMGLEIILAAMNISGKFPRVTSVRQLHGAWYHLTRSYAYTYTEGAKLLGRHMIIHALANSHRTGFPTLEQWLQLEWNQVWDWFRMEGHKLDISGPKDQRLKTNWAWFVRQSEHWHDTTIVNQVAQEIHRQHHSEYARQLSVEGWKSEIPDHVHGKFRFIPLLSPMALIQEGKAQEHCVGQSNYAKESAAGQKLIWSIRDAETDNRLATCELIWENHLGHWRLGQLLGKKNTAPLPKVKEAGQDLLKRYNKTYLDRISATRKAAIKEATKEASMKRRYQELLVREKEDRLTTKQSEWLKGYRKHLAEQEEAVTLAAAAQTNIPPAGPADVIQIHQDADVGALA